jgi:2-keto-3-deoxy-L-rhamnonate aldolase RhmA
MATPGLDVGWLGHYDLTNDLGITGQFDHPQFVTAAEELAGACRAAGKAAASLDGSLDFLRAQAERGYRLLGYGQDIAVMRNGYLQGLAALREVGRGATS